MKTRDLSILLLFSLLMVPAMAWSEVVSLHPDLPDTLNQEQIRQLDLFPDQPHARTVFFEPSAWGGVVAHLVIQHGYQLEHLERALPRSRWVDFQDRATSLIQGEETVSAPGLTTEELQALRQDKGRLQAWPEVPARDRTLPTELAAKNLPRYPSPAGKWLVQGGLGYQTNISDFGDYFGNQGLFRLGFARALTARFWFMGELSAAFGNLNSDYEKEVGDGHSNQYSAMVGFLTQVPAGQKTGIYLAALGGYARRSLQWGDVYLDPETGQQYQGHALEAGNWGYSLQCGVMFQKSHRRKARYFDFGVGLSRGLATDADVIQDQGDDTWLVFTFRFWDQI